MSLLQFAILEEKFSPLSPSHPLPAQIHPSSFSPQKRTGLLWISIALGISRPFISLIIKLDVGGKESQKQSK